MPPTVIIDLRCLQDPGYARRGIGQHTRTILSLKPANTTIIGLTDPDLPTLPPDIIAHTAEIRPNAYFPTAPPGTIFLNPSPMTHDPLFTARLLLNPSIKKAAIVYDFIPLDTPSSHLTASAARLNYLTSLAWLRKHDLFLPISAATQSRLNDLLASPPSLVTGVPLPSWLNADPAATPKHILIVAGNHPRKNPEAVIRAHASSHLLQTQRIPLIIAGDYPAAAETNFRALSKQSGGNPALLTAPGQVSEPVLLSQYQNAICAVTASRAEGFSLPVVEAMATGTPSIVSDIPAHAALVPDSSLRFAPDDVTALTNILEHIAADPAYRASIIATQATIWPAFKATTVAAKIWTAIATAPPFKINIGGHRPRIAMLSPFPPAQSGVADYSAACAAALAPFADLTLFSPTKNAAPIHHLRITDISALPHLANHFDRIISVLGNSEHHHAIFNLMKRYGSAAICHDARLLHFYAYKFGKTQTAALASTELHRPVSESEIESWLTNETDREATLLGEAATTAHPLILHAQPSVDLVRQRFQTTAHLLPFAIYRSWPETSLTPAHKQAAKARLNFCSAEIHIASFGFLSPTKGVEAALQALQHLNQGGTPYRLHWVGAPDQHATVTLNRATELGIASQLTLTPNYIPESAYRDYLLAADLGLQLRTTGAGQISGALQDCIAAGLPTIANTNLAEMLNAPTYITRVADTLNPTEIATALANIQTASHEPARAAYCEHYSMENYAENLCRILELDV
jgi:glycosyltransferase involved in cell wall biosynthesis